MRIGVLSDLHLGYKQYGSEQREQDFYIQYLKCMQKLNEEEVDLVIIAGDLFDKPNPSPNAMNVYRQGIESLGGIPVITIKGNHTMLMRDNHYSVDNYFNEENFSSDYHLLDDEMYQVGNSTIQGMFFRSDSNLDEFVDKQWKISSNVPSDTFNILVLHQAFEEYCGFSNVDLSIGDINWYPYDVIICGHIHSHVLSQIHEIEPIFFLQPGSIERMNTAEAKDGQENGKGVWIIDTEDGSIGFNPIPFEREFLLGDIEFDSVEDIENHFENLEKELKKMKVYPIISYNYYDHTGKIARIRDLMKESSKLCLINNSNVYDMSEEEIIVEFSEGELPTVVEALKSQDSLNEDESKLTADIYEAYKDGLDDSVEGIIETYFNKKIKREEDNQKKFEAMDKEIEEYEEFFEKLGENTDV